MPKILALRPRWPLICIEYNEQCADIGPWERVFLILQIFFLALASPWSEICSCSCSCPDVVPDRIFYRTFYHFNWKISSQSEDAQKFIILPSMTGIYPNAKFHRNTRRTCTQTDIKTNRQTYMKNILHLWLLQLSPTIFQFSFVLRIVLFDSAFIFNIPFLVLVL